MNIYEKLLLVQQELNAPKGQYNFFGKYHYRSCEDILGAVKPLMGKVNAVLIITDGLEFVGDRHYISATAMFLDVESGERVSVTARAREEREKKGMDGAQITGSTGSYARKYALDGLFCIDDSKDNDATNEEEASCGGMQPPGPMCEDCGVEIYPYNDGRKSYTAQEMAARSKEMFKRMLCKKCAIKAGKVAGS